MFNDWFTIGGFTVHGYGVMIAIGIILAFLLDERLAKRFGLDYERIDTFIFIVIVCGYISSKLFYCVINFKDFLEAPLTVLGSGGWVVYGGIIGGLLAGYVYCRCQRWHFMDYLNILIPSVAMAQAFGRIGCFLAGCCYGIETDAWFGVVFPAGSYAPSGVRLIPTQLISAAGDMLIFAITYRNLTKGRHPEDTGAIYLLLYSVGRFMVEFLRGDPRGTVGIFSTAQFISFFIFAFGAGLIFYRQKKGIISPALQKNHLFENDKSRPLEEEPQARQTCAEGIDEDNIAKENPGAENDAATENAKEEETNENWHCQ